MLRQTGSLLLVVSVAIPIQWTASALAQSVDYRRVQAEGIGSTYDGALRDALVEAVGQVNGVAVAKNVVGESVTGSATVQTTTQGGGLSETDTQSAAGVVAATSVHGPNGKADTVASGVAVGAAKTESVTVSEGAQISHEEFNANKTIVDSSAQMSGVVSRYQVITSEKRDDGWHVAILADIGVYKPSEASERQKLAVVPFRTSGAGDTATKFESAFRTDLVNQLTQSGKLALLDREFSQEDQTELALLSEANARPDQTARLKNMLGADYLVVGTIDGASAQTPAVYMPSVGKTVTGTTTLSAKLTYRVVEVATGQIHQAETWQASNVAGSDWAYVAATAANAVSHSILGELFPIRIERIADGVFYLGQGGDTIQVDQQYRLIRLGQIITDSYTHEALGREETDVGTIQIFEVEPKLSKARLVSGSFQPSGDDAALIVRLVPEKPQATSKPTATANRPPTSSSSAGQSLLQKENGNW